MGEDWSDSVYYRNCDRLKSMTDLEKTHLDFICGAVANYAHHSQNGSYCSPNRLFALAVVDLYKEWNEVVMNHE